MGGNGCAFVVPTGEVYGWGPKPKSQGRWRGGAGSQAGFLVPELELTSSFLLYSSLFFVVLLSLSLCLFRLLPPPLLSLFSHFLLLPLSLTPTPPQSLPLNFYCLLSGSFLIPVFSVQVLTRPLARLWTLLLSYVLHFPETWSAYPG